MACAVHLSIFLTVLVLLGLIQNSRTTKQRAARVLLTHFSNEELLLPFWIQQHAPLFDHAVLINYNSTDSSLEILSALAPASWKIVTTTTSNFTSLQSDEELMQYESLFPFAWKIVLTVGEFLTITPTEWDSMLDSYEKTGVNLIRFPSFTIVGNDSVPLAHSPSLALQRYQYAINPRQPREWFGLNRFSRFMHRSLRITYGSGRHFLVYEGEAITENMFEHLGISFSLADRGFITKYKWSPWPESVTRMLHIHHQYADKYLKNDLAGTALDTGDIVMTHQFGTAAELQKERDRIMSEYFTLSFNQQWDSHCSMQEKVADKILDQWLYDLLQPIHHQWRQFALIARDADTISDTERDLEESLSFETTNSELLSKSCIFLQPVKYIVGDGVAAEKLLAVDFFLLLRATLPPSRSRLCVRNAEDLKEYTAIEESIIFEEVNKSQLELLLHYQVFCKDILLHEDFISCSKDIDRLIRSFVFHTRTA